ncbi:MAG TPA: Rho termination factor N-terminal domain-containing protein [Solirubrobacterales bacterium]|nr:Rho termination factor N-terminal domain-containing protein [Solirubrobacterales bacterium]
MTKAELESKHLAELHSLAAEVGVPRYRMLRRAELIEKLLEEKPQPRPPAQPQPRTRERRRPERKRRRRWGLRGRGKEVRVQDLLLPPAPGRQTLVHAEGRERCTALLRDLAAELSGATRGPDPIALLIDPSPEELADWRREAPRVEIIAAVQARHADDAVAHAARRAEGGEDVILLVDSLTRLAETFGKAEQARDLLDSGASLTVVAALEQR